MKLFIALAGIVLLLFLVIKVLYVSPAQVTVQIIPSPTPTIIPTPTVYVYPTPNISEPLLCNPAPSVVYGLLSMYCGTPNSKPFICTQLPGTNPYYPGIYNCGYLGDPNNNHACMFTPTGSFPAYIYCN